MPRYNNAAVFGRTAIETSGRGSIWLLCLVASLAVAGCAMHGTTIKPSSATISQIGLPVYPGSKALDGEAIDQTMGPMKFHTTTLEFMTSDTLDRVVAFYAARLPKNAQRMSIPMGFATSTAFQFYQGANQKQVTIVSVKNMRMISLRSMQLFQTPAPSR